MMNIVQPTTADIGIKAAMQIAGMSSSKTLRRAVQHGALPRRYVLTARGPMLVFLRADLERWRAERTAPRRQRAVVTPPPEPTVTQSALLDAVRQLQAGLTKMQTAIDGLTVTLAEQQRQLPVASAAIDRLAAQLAYAELGTDDHGIGMDASEAKGDVDELTANGFAAYVPAEVAGRR